jgi:hypothetical protein
MLVSVTDFGSLWRHKFSGKENDPCRFSHGVFYNTTGIRVGTVIQQRPKIIGYARFHQCGGFNPLHPFRMVDRVFDCAEPCVWAGVNKLLFRRVLSKAERPDRFLVVIRPELSGRVRVGSHSWRSQDTWLISFSEWNEDQEAMLLMSVGSWLETELGRFFLVADQKRPWRAHLVLTGMVWK